MSGFDGFGSCCDAFATMSPFVQQGDVCAYHGGSSRNATVFVPASSHKHLDAHTTAWSSNMLLADCLAGQSCFTSSSINQVLSSPLLGGSSPHRDLGCKLRAYELQGGHYYTTLRRQVCVVCMSVYTESERERERERERDRYIDR